MTSEQTDTTMPAWQRVWREGFAPLLSTAGLEALREALASDDRRLLQGATTLPPPLQCVAAWPVEACCAVSYCGVADLGGFLLPQENPAATVAEVEEFFYRACLYCDKRLDEPCGCRHFTGWFDDTPRDEMRKLLLAEVERTLAERKVG